ncbi:isochorismatase family protein [Thalassolituus sp. LLYu03]|uniref:isochorismatase family protein n=1 Tax=Thalassolituus sp. LLYu03 TaxID=3421656 RepID=UPI003D2A4934
MKTALLVIDVQNGVFASDNQPYRAADVVTNTVKLVTHARTTGLTTVLIQHEIPNVLEPGSHAWELLADLNAGDQDCIIRKRTPDAFMGTDLNAVLNGRGIEQLIVCGYATDFCIDRTCFSAASQGYQVILAQDAHTTQNKPHLQAQAIIGHHEFLLSKHPAIRLMAVADILELPLNGC